MEEVRYLPVTKTEMGLILEALFRAKTGIAYTDNMMREYHDRMPVFSELSAKRSANYLDAALNEGDGVYRP